MKKTNCLERRCRKSAKESKMNMRRNLPEPDIQQAKSPKMERASLEVHETSLYVELNLDLLNTNKTLNCLSKQIKNKETKQNKILPGKVFVFLYCGSNTCMSFANCIKKKKKVNKNVFIDCKRVQIYLECKGIYSNLCVYRLKSSGLVLN